MRLSRIGNWHYTHRKIRKINKNNKNNDDKKEANGEHHMQPVAFPSPLALVKEQKETIREKQERNREREEDEQWKYR